MANTTVSTAASQPAAELTITRTFRTPRMLLWTAWTNAEMMKLWWGPRGFTTPEVKIDLREGGTYLTCMRSPEGTDVWSTGTYLEVVPMEKLVMTDSFSDEQGNVVPATYYEMGAEFPLEMRITVTFEDRGEETTLTLTHSDVSTLSEEIRSGMHQGWSESFDKLAEMLERREVSGAQTRLIAEPGTQEIRMVREFDAPRELVFRAFTEPELYSQWIGPRRLTTEIQTFESRSGGSWRFIQRDAEGNDFGFHGVHHEVLAPERIISTFEYEGLPEKGHVILQTSRFEELPDHRTRLTVQSIFQSVQDRDGMLMSGMEEGMNDSYRRLDELLERLKNT